ncbi:MAG TPA: HWE histidine kinase domain-containing protein, partial [Sphingomicrobium sp.]|nr:HWE histidine kinase domain-containing protein [Sphingomicrobium sp.]
MSSVHDVEALRQEISRLKQRISELESTRPEQVSQARLFDAMEQRLRLALEGTGIAVYEQDLATGTGTWSESAFRILGVEPPPDLIGSYALWKKCLHPDDRAAAEQAHADAERHRGPWTLEHRIVRQDSGEVRWLSAYGQIIDRGGSVISTGAAVDITDRKATQERLEKHASTLQKLNEVGSIVAAELDIDKTVQSVTDAGVELTGAQFGAFFYNLHAESGEVLTLYTLSGAKRSDFEQFPHPRATQVFKPTFDGTAIVRSDDITKDPRYGHNEPYHGMPANHLPVRSYLAVPVKSRSGEVIGGLFFGHEAPAVFTENHELLIAGIAPQAAVAMDNARLYREAQHEIARRKRAEAHQQLLINELNHRVKNTLAIVQSLAMQSFRPTVSPEAGKSAFDARLKALSSAHSLLTKQNWEQASLKDTLRSAVEATVGEGSKRVSCDGPDINLLPQT